MKAKLKPFLFLIHVTDNDSLFKIIATYSTMDSTHIQLRVCLCNVGLCVCETNDSNDTLMTRKNQDCFVIVR